MTELLASPTAGFAMLGTLVLILGGLYTRHIRLTTRTIIDIALMLALTIVLHQIRIFHMPQGGSVTLGAMVPLILLSYRYGPGIGALAGFLYGLVNIIQDPFIVHPVQVLFDYPLPYMAMGLAGLWSGHLYRGTALAFLARFLRRRLLRLVRTGGDEPARLLARLQRDVSHPGVRDLLHHPAPAAHQTPARGHGRAVPLRRYLYEKRRHLATKHRPLPQ